MSTQPTSAFGAGTASVIALCGKNRIAVSALSYLIHLRQLKWPQSRLVAVPNNNDDGVDRWQPSFRRHAESLNLDIVPLASLHEIPDLVLISLEYAHIIKVERFASKRLYNLHFSALPEYRGVFMSIWPILNGETRSGVTLHHLDAGIDSGAIVGQRLFDLPRSWTARQLYEKFLEEGIDLFRERVVSIVEGIPEMTTQDESKASYFSRKSLDLSLLEIDVSQPAEKVARFIRGLVFPEYQLPLWKGRRIANCALLPARSSEPPGTVLLETTGSSSVVTGDGEVIELQWAQR